MTRWIVAVVAVTLAACGGAEGGGTGGETTPPAAPPDAAAPDATPTPRPECIETDDSIGACRRAGAASSWTASAACTRTDAAGVWPGIPQKRDAHGTLTERATAECCAFVSIDGATAMCCADFRACFEPWPQP